MAKKKSNEIVFRVIDVCYQDAVGIKPDEADFFMEEDNWNDFGYRTTYHLHATSNITGTKNRHLGTINVMRKGQTTEDSFILTKLFKQQNGYFTKLPDNYCSISFSDELYLQLSKLLNDEQRKNFANALRMIFGTDSAIYEEVKDEECFETSFLRDSSMNAYSLRQGKTYMLGSTVYYDLENKRFSFRFPNRGDAELVCSVHHVEGIDGKISLPTGIIVFIGHNGSGKSTIIYQMAKVLFATPRQRRLLKDVIQVSPSDIGITKLLLFSYSAFDNFVLPGFNLSDYQLMSDGMIDNSGRFVYCGLRDVKSELDDYLSSTRQKKRDMVGAENVHGDDETLERFREDRQQETIIQKPLSVLAAEFEKALSVIHSDKDKRMIWKAMIGRSQEILVQLYNDIKVFGEIADGAAADFQKLSTGIKFFLHSLSHLLAYIAPNSLILFDEPENHLHPPLLSFLLGEFRRVIHENHSVMLIATHSPVILQETFSQNIYVIKKDGGVLSVSHPIAETFGENFGFINNMVFELTTDMANYYEVCDLLFDEWNCKSMLSVDEVIDRYEKQLGMDHLSSQMAAYLISKYMNKDVSQK